MSFAKEWPAGASQVAIIHTN